MKQKSLLRSMLLLFALIVGMSSAWADGSITFDFEDDTAHRTSGSNSYSSDGNTYTENNVSISLKFADAVTTGSPLNGSANVLGRVAKNTTNSPVVLIGPISITDKTIKSVSYKTKGVEAMAMAVEYSLDNANWNSLQALSSMPTTLTTESISNLNITGTNFYLRFTVSVSSSTSSNRDFQLDDIVISYAEAGSTFKVTYNGNENTGGTVPTDDNEYESGATVTVLDNTGNLTKTGYSFGGWNTKTDGTGTNYTAGNTFTISASTTLYAKWVANTHVVTLPATDAYGSYTMDTTNPVAYGTEVKLTYTPASGYDSYKPTWSVNGDAITGNKFTMPDADVSVTVSLEEVIDYATLPFSWNSSYGTAPTGITNNSVGTGGSGDNTYLKFDATGDFIVLKIKEQPGTLTFDIKGNPGSGTTIDGTFKVQASTDGNNYIDLDSYVNLSNTVQNITIANLSANVRYIKWVYATKTAGNVALSNIALAKYVAPTSVTATIASSGYTTFCSPFDLSFENVDGLNAAYVVSQSTDAVATLKKVTAVPAGTGVVLKGTAGPVSIPVVEYTGDVISNLLEGTLEETPVEAETVYVVSGGKFMLFAGTSIPAHKAYLPVSAIGEGAPSLSFEFDDETTGIQNIERTINDNQYYTLDGRRVTLPTKGLYILNGRKVIVK